MNPRPLRFRIWDSVTSHWTGFETCIGQGYVDLSDNYPLIITQFTGLTDSKGVDIYEGDIVRITTKEPRQGHHYFQGERWMDDGSDPFELATRTLRVQWGDAMWESIYLDWVKTCSGEHDGEPVTGILSSSLRGAISEVISNIFENPDSIK